MHDGIIFDLDGTLWDSTPACARAWNRAIATHGLTRPPLTADDIRGVCGRPQIECIKALVPDVPAADFDALHMKIDQEELTEVDNDGGTLYPGLISGLQALHHHFPLFIVSNCQDWYLRIFMDLPPVQGLFRDATCHGMTGATKADNIGLIVGKHRLADPVYVGDTRGDQSAAREANVAFIHAAYGFEEILPAPTNAGSIDALVSLLHPPTQKD